MAELMKSDLIPFGTSPRPRTPEALVDRLRQLLGEELGDSEFQLDVASAAFTAEMRGPDIRSLVIDLSGVKVTLDPSKVTPETAEPLAPGEAAPTPPPPPEPEPAPEVLRRESGVVHQATLRALPLDFLGAAVEVEAGMKSVDFEWLDLADGSLALVTSNEQGGWRQRTKLNFRLGLVVDEVLAAVMAVVGKDMLPADVRLSRERIRLRQQGPRRVRVDGRIRVRWKFLAATFRGSVGIHIDSKNILRMSPPVISSRHVLAGPLLFLFRGRINKEFKEANQPFDLNEDLAPFRIRSLRIRAGRKLEFSVELSG